MPKDLTGLHVLSARLDSPSVKRALQTGIWWREVPFMLNHASNGDPEHAPLTNCRVDLVFRDGDELVVVDYKTDKDVTKETAEQYARQHHGGQGEVYQQGLTLGQRGRSERLDRSCIVLRAGSLRRSPPRYLASGRRPVGISRWISRKEDEQ